MKAELQSISVIIPVRNRAGLIGACLKHLFLAAQQLAPTVSVEIVVADDASTDETPKVVEGLSREGAIPIRLVTLPERQGPARARNAALEIATGELVMFVDSDVIVSRDFFVGHLEEYERGGTATYVVGTLVSVPSLKEALKHPTPTAWDYSGATLDTANASVPMKHLQEVGFFDPDFLGMGWQDLDLGRRLGQLGLTRIQAKGATAYHIQPVIDTQQKLEERLQKERERGVSAVRYMKKHPGFSSRMAAQDTSFHRFLSWAFRMGGFVREDNVLRWVKWARRHNLTALEKMWLAGIINKAHLDSLAVAKRGDDAL